MKKIPEIILNFPKTILFIIAFITIFFGYNLLSIELDQSFDSMILKDDADLAFYNKVITEFGSDEFIIVLFKSENLFTPEHLSIIDKITNKIKEIPNINKVKSITNLENIYSQGTDLDIHPLIEKIPVNINDPSLIKLKKDLLSSSLFINNFISKDGKVTAIIAQPEYIKSDKKYSYKLVNNVNRILEEEISDKIKENLSVYCAGWPIITITLAEYMRDSFLYVSIFIALIIFIILLVYFNSLRGVLLPVLSIIIVEVWMVGLMASMNKPVSVLSVGLPSLLVIISVLDAIHILSEYYKYVYIVQDKREAILKTISHCLTPCFLTSITTSVGFLSLAVIDIPALREFGFFAAFGVMVAFLITILVIPILLSYLKKPKGEFISRVDGVMNGLLHKMTLFYKRPALILTISLIVVVLTVYSISKIKVETDNLTFFQESDPVKKSEKFVRKHLGGATILSIVLSGQENSAKDPNVLKKISTLQSYVESLDYIEKSISLADYLKAMNKAMNNDNAKFYSVPETLDLISQYLLLYSFEADSNDIEDVVNFDYSTTRIVVKLATTSATEILNLVEKINIFSSKLFKDEIKIRIASKSFVLSKTVDTIVFNILKSLILALITISIFMMIQIRSFKLGLIIMIPNLLPTIAILSTMAILGFDFNYANGIMCIILIGVAVDDTIHFITRYKKEIQVDNNLYDAVTRVMLSPTGKAIMLTTLCFFLGLIPLYFSNFAMFNDWGILWQLSMVVAFLGDLVVLPSLLMFFKAGLKNLNRAEIT